MAYEDISETENRGMFSPPTGGAPQEIPDYWRNSPDEEPRTDLPELTDEELNALGWKGPIAEVPLDNYTQEKVWNTETREWDILELDQIEKEKRVDYQKFWDDLLYTSAYQTIKSTASKSLVANTIVTEFIALLTDAKNGHASVPMIQAELIQIIENVPFTPEEHQQIETAFTDSGMHSIYTLKPI